MSLLLTMPRPKTLVAAVLSVTSLLAQAQVPTLPSAFSDKELKTKAQSFLRVLDSKERSSAAVSVQAAEFAGYVAGYIDAKTDGPNPDPTLAECLRKKPFTLIAKRTAIALADASTPGSGSARFDMGFAVIMACRDDMWNKPAAASPPAGWQKFGENDRLVAYYQPQSKPTKGIYTVWVMYDYKSEQESQRSGRRYRSQKGQQEVDCAQERTRTVFFTWHAGQMGDGAVAYTGNTALPWEPNSPGSIAKSLASVVCTQR